MHDLKMKETCINWKAKWIWKDYDSHINDFAYFRKEFELLKPVRGAKLYVSAHNHFELYANGVRVSGYLSPAPTHPLKSKYYLCYNVKPLLKTGMNTFCACVHYIGGGGQNYADGLPGFILECHIDYDDSTQDVLATDENWKAQGDTPFRNETEFQQRRRISAIEDYNACREEKGWLRNGFDDRLWSKACLSRINDEGWVMKPQAIPEGKIHEAIVPSPAGIQKKGLQVFDAGKIITGWPRIELPGVKGAIVRMRYSEDMDGAGRVKHNVCNEESDNYYDQYTMKGEGPETWEPCFSYKAFRYVELTGYPELVGPEDIKLISAGTGLTYNGYFNSSNKLLNDIYSACIQTQKNNVTGQIVDCPHREQAQYLADSDLQAETFIYNFKESSVLEKVLLDFKDAQFEDGRFPFVFPTNIDNPHFNVKIPEWDLHFVSLLWKVYYMYDNIGILHSCYKTAKKAVDYYLGIRNTTTGLAPKAEGFPIGWNISDWPYPNIDETGQYLTVQNCKLYNATRVMSAMAAVIGMDDDAAGFDCQATALRESILKHLYLPERKRFADCYGSEQAHQGTNVVAFQYGLVPESDRESLLDFIVAEGFGCSTLLSLNLLQVLFENGKGREAYNLINRTEQPGWGHMVAKGYKTVWEGFKDTESHSHAWNAYPARIFVEYLVGIKAAAPGFREIDIRPFIPSDMRYAEGKVTTVQGKINVRWDADDNGVTFKVSIPAGSTARILHPQTGAVIKYITRPGENIFKL